MALIGLGYRSISMSPAAIGPVKAMLCELNVGRLEDMLSAALASGGAFRNLRRDLQAFAAENGVPL